MSALDLMRQQMDELMGKNRNGDKSTPELVFTDRDVCKNFLLGVCPRDIFVNTKKEEPPCGSVHDDKLQAAYEKAIAEGKTFDFEDDVAQFLEYRVRDLDRELNRAQDRLALQQQPLEDEETTNKIMDLANEIGKKLAQAEALGEEGKVDDAQALLKEVESIKREKQLAEEASKELLPKGATKQQKLRVCDVCSAYLSLFDSDRRLADHFGGKVHAGCLKIRTLNTELKKQLMERRQRGSEHVRSNSSNYNRERSSGNDRDRRSNRDGSARERERSGRHSRSDREKSDRRRERSRSRDRRSSRERSSRRERSRSRDRRNSRERSSRRERDDDRRRRSRSRERTRR
eukprot:CFRG7464T1